MQSINALDFQDSEVSSAALQEDHFVINFSAGRVCQVKDRHDTGNDAGYFQAMELKIHRASIMESESGCVGRISQGTLRVAGITAKLVPVPYDVEVDVEIELAFANGSKCKVAGQRVTLKATSEADVIEWLKC